MRGESEHPPPPPEAAEPGPDHDPDPAAAEALRLLAMAEARLASASASASASSLKSALKYAKRAVRLRPGIGGAAALVSALRVLRADPSDHYGVLRLPPLSSAAAIRRRYKALALDLHPDRSPLPSSSSTAAAAAEEAFKRVAESFRVLSDRSLKRRLDLRLRLRRRRRSPPPEKEEKEQRAATFWTACATCRLLHEFHRRYVGYRLVCPSCRKSFLAVEVPNPDSDDDGEAEDAEQEEEEEEEAEENGDGDAEDSSKSRVRASSRARAIRVTKSRSGSRPRVSRFPPLARQKRRIEPRLSNSPLAASKKPRTKPEKTLAEMQMELSREKKRKERKGNVKPLLQPKEEEEENDDSSLMVVEDSDFYDFDKDRSEKSFRKGQIWAIYDDDDGMPRHYGLIEEVVSSDPFRIRMSWLDIENHGDEQLLILEKSGFHISCGRFKIGRRVEIRSVNLFSHLIECERAATELFRVYPKKGSVWALYGGDRNAGGEEERRRRDYDIVVLLTGYSDMYGVSTAALLEKVGGYKSVFKRREVGARAIRCIEKEDVRVFSHQIPARKLSGTEGLDLPRDCWELDPASLPAAMLSVTWSR